MRCATIALLALCLLAWGSAIVGPLPGSASFAEAIGQRRSVVPRTNRSVAVARDGGVASTFAIGGVSVSVATRPIVLLGLAALGRGFELHALPAVAPSWRGDQVVYRHGSVIDWYRSGPLGLEQGVTLARRPSGLGALTLAAGWLPVRVSAKLAAHGSAVSLRDGSASGSISYGDLTVTDARGRRLPARIRLVGRRVLIRIDDASARYPVTVDPLVQAADLTVGNGGLDDGFGSAVATSETTIVAGAPGHQVGLNSGQGTVYVFTQADGQWIQSGELNAGDGVATDAFGTSVGLSGSTIVVGAPGRDSGQGAIYVFTQQAGGEWQQTAELTAADGAAGDQLGASVGVSGDTIAAGAPGLNAGKGAVYAFRLANGSWQQQIELTASDGAAGEKLGTSVSVSGTTIAAGAPFHAGPAGDALGGVYVFTLPSGQQTELAKTNPSGGDELGQSVSISGATLVAGAPGHDVHFDANTILEQGEVDVFTQSGGQWSQSAELVAADGSKLDKLGWSVGLSGNEIVGGAVGKGEIYGFTDGQSGWSQTDEISSAGTVQGDHSGYSVAAAGGVVAAGAPARQIGSNPGQGAVDVFAQSSPAVPGRHDTADDRRVPVDRSAADRRAGLMDEPTFVLQLPVGGLRHHWRRPTRPIRRTR